MISKKNKALNKNSDMPKKIFKPKFFYILVLFSVLPLILSIAIIAFISMNMTILNLESSANQKLYIVASSLANHCKENNITFATTDKYNEYLDGLMDQNIHMAILLDGCPAVTSIKNDSGYRIREIPCSKSISDDAELLLAGGFADNNVLIEDKTYMAYYMPIMCEDKIIGIAMAAEESSLITGDLNKAVILVLGASIILFIGCTLTAFYVGKKVEKAFLHVSHNVNLLAAGDLGKKKDRRNVIREMDQLADATNKMQLNLCSTIGQVKKMSESLVGSVEDVVSLSRSSTARAQSITTSMEEMSKASVSMTENVLSINDQMKDMGNDINDIAVSTKNLHATSNDIMVTNNAAKDSMNNIMKNSRESMAAVENITRQIRDTDESIAEIDSAVDLILSIADQTSLLSLNASIEAARAGENGKGFAVVAEEIRKLAEQSSEGAEQIRSMSMNISEKSQNSVKLMELVQTLMRDEQQNISNTCDKYDALSECLEYSVKGIHMINDKTERLANSKESIIVNIHELSAISEKNAAASQEITANVLQIISDFENVNDNCEDMNGMAKNLEDSIAFFVI